jgi:hypothetical protein
MSVKDSKLFRVSTLTTIVGGLAAIASDYVDEATVVMGIGIIGMVASWWAQNKESIADDLEDLIEDELGLDVEVDAALDKLADSVHDVAEETLERVAEGQGDVTLVDALEDALEAEIEEETGVSIEININIMSVAELKEHLRELGLKVSGRKAELQARLREAVE